jgi:hypothetical protein
MSPIARLTAYFQRLALALAASSAACVVTEHPPADADAADADAADADAADVDAEADADSPGAAVAPLYELAATATTAGFYDHPFPSDARRTAAGAPDLATFYTPTPTALIDGIRAAIERDVRGFSPSAGVYVRFDGPLDPGSLPATPADTLDPAASAYVVDVDPASPGYGERWPVAVTFYENGGRYYRPNLLVVRPPLGRPLRPGTTYAAVVTDAVAGADGRAPARSAAFDALLADAPPPGRAAEWEALRPLVASAAASGGLDHVLVATVFTTADHLAELRAYREWIHAHVPAPAASAWRVRRAPAGPGDLAVYEGRFDMMDFLVGEPPYDGPGEGVIASAAGEPAAGRVVSVRFVVTVPPGEPPAGGWPVALYAHGAGGDAASFVEPEAEWAAAVGVAMVSMDNPMHGDRNPTGEPFVDYLIGRATTDIAAARDLYRHGVLDQIQLLRLACGGLAVPALVSVTGRAEPLDCAHPAFVGHSMGSQIGAILVAVEPDLRSAFLSEGGGSAATGLVLRKSNDVDIEALVAVVLGIDLDREPLTADHPVVGLLVQTLLDAGDPLTYAYAPLRDAAAAPVSIFMTEGLDDDQTLPDTIEALAAAYGLPVVAPATRPSAAHALWGLPPAAPPLEANLLFGPTPATGGLVQHAGHGHYVLYENAALQERFRRWLESAAAGSPRIVDVD